MDLKNCFSALKRTLSFVLCLFFLLSLPSCQTDSQMLTYTLFDFADSESALLKFQNTTALIDCGESQSFLLLANELSLRGIDKLDYLFLSHPHSDHIGAAANVIRHYKPKFVVLPKVDDAKQAFKDVLEAAEEYGASPLYCGAGEHISFGDAEIEILAPVSSLYTNPNNCSLVLRVVVYRYALLLMGDAEIISEHELLHSNQVLKADVIKLAHHGSATSTTPEFAAAVSPSVALFTPRPMENLANPDQSVVETLTNLNTLMYNTNAHGTITVTCSKDSLSITTEK